MDTKLSDYGWVIIYCIIGLLSSSVFVIINIKSQAPLDDFFNASPGSSLIRLAHSLRAGNIVIWIDEFNSTPRINQNIAQSIFAAIPSVFGLRSPQLALSMWEGLVSYMLIVVIAAWMYFYQRLSILGSVGATAIVWFANSALSIHYVTVTDTGSTVGLIASADSYLSLTYLLVSLILVDCLKIGVTSYATVLIIFIICVALNLIGAHTLVTLIPFLLVIIWFRIGREETRFRLLNIYSALIFGVFIGALCGGMLMPSQFAGNEFIPGVLSFQNSNANFVTFKKFFLNGFTPGLVDSNEGIINVIYDQRNVDAGLSIVSISYIFFPLLGYFLALWITFTTSSEARNWPLGKEMVPIAFFMLMCLGVFLGSSIILNGYIWEMSRFLQSGVFFGNLLLAYCCIKLLIARHYISKALAVFLIVFCVYGPVAFFYSETMSNLNKMQGTHFFSEEGNLASIVKTNQVACGNWLPMNFDIL